MSCQYILLLYLTSQYIFQLTVIKENEKNSHFTNNIGMLETFFMELRNHVKKLLTKNGTKLDETKFLNHPVLRYIYAPKCETTLLPDSKNFSNIQQKYEKYFVEISDFLKLYNNKKVM